MYVSTLSPIHGRGVVVIVHSGVVYLSGYLPFPPRRRTIVVVLLYLTNFVGSMSPESPRYLFLLLRLFYSLLLLRLLLFPLAFCFDVNDSLPPPPCCCLFRGIAVTTTLGNRERDRYEQDEATYLGAAAAADPHP